MAPQTVWGMLSSVRTERAIGAPSMPWMSGAALRDMAAHVRTTLARAGVGPEHRVAVILPNGPEMASSFLCFAGTCCVAPINPALKEAEIEFILQDVKPAAIVLSEQTYPVSVIAERLSIPVISLRVTNNVAGAFMLDVPRVGSGRDEQPTRPEQPALILHTSGTTARPKMVPLSNENIMASAAAIAKSLQLSADDVCLNIMPLFHIHGLMAAVTASIFAGGGVCCTPGFNAFTFLDDLNMVQPSWYTAVPTMHQAILERIRVHPGRRGDARLRFIRSSSAPLAAEVMRSLEQVFETPVVEAYGMTEAAHQMTANPLPPGQRKAGSVGIPADSEVAVIDLNGARLPHNMAGEVIVRGSNVMSGYLGAVASNDAAFIDGWLRTGDEGFIDDDGYLFLSGRLKEQINRGGEKINPLELERVLSTHGAVFQACAFAIPHRVLGEEVGAIVVPRRGETLSEPDLRMFMAARLAAFKVPRRIVVATTIPVGPTGKLQRSKMAALLGLDDRPGGLDPTEAAQTERRPMMSRTLRWLRLRD